MELQSLELMTIHNKLDSITLRITETADSTIWDDYLNNHDQSNFYQLHKWKDINERNFGHDCFFIIAEDNKTVVGVFPLVFIKSKIFGKILSSMPFVNFGGLCANSSEIAELLLNKAKEICQENAVDYLEIRTQYPISDNLPTNLHKISMTLALDKESENIWNAFKSKHRTNIRRVYKQNITVKQGGIELLDTFYKLMSESWRGLGTPIYQKKYFKDILETFPDQTKIFITYKDNTPIATAFNGYYKGTVEGMWAGAIPEFKRLQPNYVLYWEMIKDACENGCHHFHLGRSTSETGAETFKKKWNATAKQLYWQYILENSETIPQLNVSNPKYQLAIKLWSKLPLKVTTTLGPIIARSIP